MTESEAEERDRLLKEAVRFGLIKQRYIPNEGPMTAWNPEFFEYLTARVNKATRLNEYKMM